MLLIIRQFTFGLAIGCAMGGAPWLAAGFLFTAFVIWSVT